MDKIEEGIKKIEEAYKSLKTASEFVIGMQEDEMKMMLHKLFQDIGRYSFVDGSEAEFRKFIRVGMKKKWLCGEKDALKEYEGYID